MASAFAFANDGKFIDRLLLLHRLLPSGLLCPALGQSLVALLLNPLLLDALKLEGLGLLKGFEALFALTDPDLPRPDKRLKRSAG